MKSAHWDLPHTLGALRRSRFSEDKIGKRSIKDELRQNLIQCIRQKKPLFPGIVGYDDTVVPQIINAVLSRHNFILLGLRGQAKTRLIRMLTGLLDSSLPYIAGCEIHDNPYHPICRHCRNMVEEIHDPLVHLIRNSVDHGIEPAGEREAAGKPPQGTVTLRARHQGGSVVISVEDGRFMAVRQSQSVACGSLCVLVSPQLNRPAQPYV